MNLNPKKIEVHAAPYRCYHRAFRLPYWAHRAYELEIVGHGCTMAPSKNKVREWATDWLVCNYGGFPDDYEVTIEWL